MGKKTYEEVVFPVIGERGFFQISICLLIAVTFWLGGGPFNFVMIVSEHWCQVPRLSNFSHAQQKYLAIPKNEDGEYSSCTRFNVDFDHMTQQEIQALGRTDLLKKEVIPCDQGWVYDQSEMVESVIMKYDLVCNREYLVSLAPSIAISGGFFAAPTAGFFSDILGRRKTLLAFHFLGLVAYILQWLAPNYIIFVVGMILGWASGHGGYLAMYVLVIELVGKKLRGVMGPVMDIIWSLGGFLWCFQASIIRHYYYIYLLPILGFVPIIASVLMVTESPRWLVINRKYNEAEKALRLIAQVNHRPVPDDFSQQLRQIRFDETGTDKEDSSLNCSSSCVAHGMKRAFLKLKALLRTKAMRKRTCIVTIHWMCDAMIFYALSYNIRFIPGNIYINAMILTAVELPANFASIFFVQWRYTGRRLTCALSMLFAGLAAFSVIPFQVTGLQMGEVATIMFGRMCISIAFSCIYIYTPELHPTEVRNTGMGFSSVFARLSGMAGPMIGGPLRKVKVYLPNIIFGVCGVTSGCLTFLLPETLNRDLPDIADDTDLLEDSKEDLKEKNAKENKVVDTCEMTCL